MESGGTRSKGLVNWIGKNTVAAVVILAMFVALAAGALGLWQSPVSAGGQTLRPAESVKNFTQGQATFDAQLMWDSLSDDMVHALQVQGVDADTVQRQMDALKDTGVRYTDVTYVGGKRAPTGETYYVYILVHQNGEALDSAESVPYVFMVDSDGKIAQIE